jgi:diaminohydroxyphosphoribosylaminopyrimidine deaminase/5-amino-6-(5-phosphoribosylamino)uracil reductase
MQQAINLAIKSFGRVAPNPMVGCVIVYNGKVIGKGYHEKYGEAHAEINALRSVKNKALLKDATLYVTLEPCAHHGKTPPCADTIIKHGIKKVIIGCVDPNPLVKGKGIAKLMHSGCTIITGVLEKECTELNKRFFTFHREKRPYIILKWAMTKDGYIDKIRTIDEKPLKITGKKADKLSHKWRSEEQAIMVGTRTTLMDDPMLTNRLATGKLKDKSPIRIILDRNLVLPREANIFNKFAKVIVLNEKKNSQSGNTEFVKIKFKKNALDTILDELYNRNIQSLIVEGGASFLNSFITQGLWDEARVFISPQKAGNGIKAPIIKGNLHRKIKIGSDTLYEYLHPANSKMSSVKS